MYEITTNPNTTILLLIYIVRQSRSNAPSHKKLVSLSLPFSHFLSHSLQRKYFPELSQIFAGISKTKFSQSPTMKKPGIFAASVAVAASATVISAASTSYQEEASKAEREKSNSTSQKTTSSTDKFAPRFDGLRFIETLVTAHR